MRLIMLRTIGKYFINGILTIAPVALTIFIVVWVFNLLGSTIGKPVGALLGYPHSFIGLIFSVALITLIGFLSTIYFTQKILDWIEGWFQRVPGVKIIYSIFSDTLNTMFGQKRNFSKVALVSVPGTQAKIIGFVTSEDVSHLGDFAKNHVAVYVMQSMQWAGHTFLIPKKDVEFIDIGLDQAMKFVVSAGIAQHKDHGK